MGWKTFKADGGSRLMRDGTDDSRHIQVREGTAGWKEGLTFVRLYRYRKDAENKTLYTLLCLDRNDSIIAIAKGNTDKAVWKAMYADLNAENYDVREGV
jgi:hypothetical protein